MPVMLKRGLFVVAALLVIAVIAIAALPLIASTQLVRDRIAQELGALSGYRVALGRAPQLSFWPIVTARLDDIVLTGWSENGDVPVMEADRMEAELSAFAALRGEVVFNRVRLIRPVLRVRPSGRLIYEPSAEASGKISESIELARQAMGAAPQQPDLSILPTDPVGLFEFSEGRIIVVTPEGEHEAVSSLAGRLDWTTLNRAASLNSTGIWRGENFELSVTSPQPLLLMAGGSARLSINLRSAPLEGSYEGSANLSSDPFFDGSVKVSMPSLRRALEWSGSALLPAASIGAVTASSTVAGSPQRLKLANAEIIIDGNRGMGALELGMAGAIPSVTGTLAFGNLDLSAILVTLAPVQTPTAAGTGANQYRGLATQANFDLRLSAAQARAGRHVLTNAATTVQARDGLSVFDLSDASVLGGNVQASAKFDSREGSNQAEFRLNLSEVDVRQLVADAGLGRLSPQGKGNVAVTMKGEGDDWNAILHNASGTISTRLGQGRIEGLNLDSFIERVSLGGFFPLDEVVNGSIPVASLDFKAALSKGVARVEVAEIATDNRLISLRGIIPYLGRGLALSGTISPGNNPSGSDPHPAHFFVGGSWDAPIVSPIVAQWVSE